MSYQSAMLPPPPADQTRCLPCIFFPHSMSSIRQHRFYRQIEWQYCIWDCFELLNLYTPLAFVLDCYTNFKEFYGLHIVFTYALVILGYYLLSSKLNLSSLSNLLSCSINQLFWYVYFQCISTCILQSINVQF